MNTDNHLLNMILKIASVPSFSYAENRLHSTVIGFLNTIDGVQINIVDDHNLVVYVPGVSDSPPVGLTAHLDKIDHYGKADKTLHAEITDGKIIGAMDDSVGVAICLALAQASTLNKFPPLLLLFSEQEECGGAGARNISNHLIKHNLIPDSVITIDTTPLLRGKAGLALYTDFWENRDYDPTQELQDKTKRLCETLLNIDPDLYVLNNSNDYITYGCLLNDPGKRTIPSIALEVSIYPYHQPHEEVYISDVLQLKKLLVSFLATTDQ